MSHVQRIGHYRLGKNLGIGSFGKVRRALAHLRKTTLAMGTALRSR